MKQTTKAVFRVFDDGDVMAVLFDEQNTQGETRCYMAKGVFFFAKYSRIQRLKKPSTRKQYKPVFTALLNEGYKRITVYQRARKRTQSSDSLFNTLFF